MFEKQTQEITGNGNQQANGNINNINIYSSEYGRPAAIEKVLSGIYDVAQENLQKFAPPDTKPYTIEDKIEYNDIELYREFYDDFMSGYALVKYQIDAAAETDPNFENKITEYIKAIYISVWEELNEEDRKNPNAILWHMRQILEKEISSCSQRLAQEEIKAIGSVVFYIFAKCKIFKKPPENYADTK